MPPSFDPTHVAIVIVNYRTPDLVTACLDSLKDEAGDKVTFQVFVGDADSQDGSVEQIKDHIATAEYDDWVLCYDIGRNGGFAFGNNAIFQAHVANDRSFDYVYFLNPDTYIYPGAVRYLVRFLQKNDKVGVAGNRLENPDGSLRAYGFRFPNIWREFFRGARLGILDRIIPSASISIPDLRENREVDWVSGAGFMMPRAVLDDVGLMDDGYFLYFEETDLMKRVRNAGYQVWHVAESRIVHLAGQATGVRTGDAEIKRLSPVWLASRRKFLRKHYGSLAPACATALFLAGDVCYRCVSILRRRKIQNPPFMWRDYLRPSSGDGR